MTISKTTAILAGVTTFTILAIWAVTTGKGASAPESKIIGPAPTSSSSRFETKEQADDDVTVTVTPQELATGKPAIFQIAFDTHSVNLDFDIVTAVEFRDEQGNTYGPPTWKGDPPGGHHREGTLSFPIALEQGTSVSLTLKNIADVKERSFLWKL